jgi:hypothetical protein
LREKKWKRNWVRWKKKHTKKSRNL